MQASNGKSQTNGHPTLVQELVGGELYEYYPLGQYIVSAPDVCGGRPTFKYTRIEASFILAQLSTGRTIEELVTAYELSHLSAEAVREAILLAGDQLAHLKPALSIPEPVPA